MAPSSSRASGFYETDYRRAGETAGKNEGEVSKNGDAGKGEAKEAKTGTPAAASDAPAKSETKSESKGESKGGGGAKKKK